MATPDERGGPLAEAGHSLCLACGACCNGMWFQHIQLAPEEVPLAQNARMPVYMVEGEPRVPQPCVCHREGRCTAYDSWRPTACAKYQCKLLEGVVTGSMPLTVAMGHASAVRAMAERIRAALPNLPDRLLGRQLLQRLADGSGPPSADVSPDVQLDAVALNRYYMKYFQPPPSSPPEAAGKPESAN